MIIVSPSFIPGVNVGLEFIHKNMMPHVVGGIILHLLIVRIVVLFMDDEYVHTNS